MDLSEFAEEIGSTGPVTIAGLATRGGPVDGVRPVMAPVGIDWIQPEEMTVQCAAGTPVEELDAALARHGQAVAVPPTGTIGGALAVGHSGIGLLLYVVQQINLGVEGRPLREGFLYGFPKFFDVDRLQQVVEGAVPEGPHGIFVVCGDENHAEPQRQQTVQHIEPVQLRHFNVQKQKVRRIVLQNANGLHTIGKLPDIRNFRKKLRAQMRQKLHVVRFVVEDKSFHFLRIFPASAQRRDGQYHLGAGGRPVGEHEVPDAGMNIPVIKVAQ